MNVVPLKKEPQCDPEVLIAIREAMTEAETGKYHSAHIVLFGDTPDGDEFLEQTYSTYYHKSKTLMTQVGALTKMIHRLLG